jgi:hypothetical protein
MFLQRVLLMLRMGHPFPTVSWRGTSKKRGRLAQPSDDPRGFSEAASIIQGVTGNRSTLALTGPAKAAIRPLKDFRRVCATEMVTRIRRGQSGHQRDGLLMAQE